MRHETTMPAAIARMAGDTQPDASAWQYAIVFPAQPHSNTPDKYSLRSVVTRLQRAGLQTKLFMSTDRTRVFVKIRAVEQRLLQEAERIGYALTLDPDELADAARRPTPRRGPVSLANTTSDTKLSPWWHIHAKYTTNPAHQQLYQRHSAGGLLRPVDKLKLLTSIIRAPLNARVPGAGLDLAKLAGRKFIASHFVLHDKAERSSLLRRWVRLLQWPWAQPLEETRAGPGVRDYFGEKVALYFAWLGHYTAWLSLPALFGAILFFVQLTRSDTSVPLMIPYSILVAFWATFFIEFWKRKESKLAMQWGMTDYEETEQPRPQYKGSRILSPVTGAPDVYASPTLRMCKLLLSQMVIWTAVICVAAAVVGIFFFRVYATSVHPMQVAGWNVGPTLAALLNAVTIMTFNRVYGYVAWKLNAFENHRTDTQFEDHLIAKTFLFQFVNSYSSLFYVAFVKGRVRMLDQSTECEGGDCMSELAMQLGIIFVTQLVVNNVQEVLIPYIKYRMGRRQQTKRSAKVRVEDETHSVVRPATSANGGTVTVTAGSLSSSSSSSAGAGAGAGATPKLSSVEKQLALPAFDNTFSDYSEMVIQFGYVTLFVSAFPLAPLLAMINNYVEIRVDAFKLCRGMRRPEPRGTEDIGTWCIILDLVSKAATLTNLALVLFTADVLEHYSLMTRLWMFLVGEHVILALRFLFEVLIGDVPRDVQIQLQRQEFLVQKVILEVEDEPDAPVLDMAVHVQLDVHDHDEDDDVEGSEEEDEEVPMM